MRSTASMLSVLVAIVSLSFLKTAFAQNLSFADWQRYNSAWHMDYIDKLLDERLDPIVNPNGISGHLHQVIGGSRFGASYNGAEYKAASCTTCPIKADKSNYWMPKLFWINNGGTSFTPVSGGQRFYYFLQQSSPNEKVSAFPDGLRMLVGNPDSKVADNFRFSFTCQVNPPPYVGSIRSDNFNFERDCPNGMKVETHFPQCWDGVNLYKSDGSHMSYPVGTSYRVGNCPWTHPIRIPQVMTEFTYYTSSWAPGQALKGNVAWANGDTTGYGVHADFVNGWEGDVLARALNDSRCTTGDEMAIEQCPIMAPYYDYQASRSSSCKPEKGVMLEGPQINDNVPIPRLPGCSPLWDGTGSKPACPAGDFQPDISRKTGSDGPYTANPTRNFVLPTTPGWKDIGCIRESYTMLKGLTEFYDQSISQTTCENTCLKNGFNYAAVGLTQGKYWKCLCGTGVEEQAQLWPQMCNSPCPGNSSQVCGGDFSGYSVFYAPPGTTQQSGNSSYLGCYQNPSTASQGLEGKATYTFSTNTMMTQEMCFQACADRGLGWAAIRSGQNCFCGADNDFNLGSGKYVSDATCNMNCTGNKAQVCGFWTGSSVFNVTALGYTKKDLGMPAGYQGCYNLPSGKAVNDFTYWDNALVPERCTLGCLELGYQYAEVDTGRICNCGNKLSLGNSQPPSFCQTACFGAANQTCGGSWNGDLYTTNSSQPRLDALKASKHAGWTGCFDNSKAGGFKDWSRSNAAAQTVDRCQISCSELGYKWAGLQNGDTCKCSNVAPETQIKQTPTSLSCNAPCKGNSSETCGGTGGMIEAFDLSKYTQEVVNNNGPGYVGCYSQTAGPGLKGGTYYDDKLTVEMCAGMCKETGFSMAGLSNNQCTCGNTWEGGNVLASLSCTAQCPGNATQTCGASFIASVFNSTIGPDVTMPVAGYAGCWTDNANRTLPAYTYSSRDGMSPSACKTTCAGRGFAYSGVQNGYECYCDNKIGGIGKQVPSSQCSAACTGNSAQKCGASWRLSVYSTGSNGTTPAPAVVGKSIACYQDFNTLDGANYYSDYMSANLCLPWCKAKGFSLGGMSGRQCRCGNTSPTIVSARTTCSLPCSGNSTQTCGSSSGYADVWSTATVFAANANPYTTPDNKGYMGCWTDGASRLLTGSVFYSNSLTPATCAANCAGSKYTFAGLQNGNECRCGNTLDPKTTYYRTGENECPKACTGDANTKCGGSYRYNIYATKEFLAGGTNSSTTNPTAKPEGNLGCYGRGTFASSTAVQTVSGNGMTTGYCRRYCRIKGFSTAGLMGGNTCYCGTQNTLAAVVPDAGCTAACTGNSTSTCGGDITLSVYNTNGAGALTVPGYPSDYVGCYVDGTPRLLPAFSVKTNAAAPAQCKAVCDAKGYPLYGLQNGNECFCGSLSNTDIVPDNQCSTNCAGDATQKCGGWYRMSVFGKLTSNTTTTSVAPSSTSSSSRIASSSSSVSSSRAASSSSSSSSSRAGLSSASSAAATTSRASSSSAVSASVSRSASASATTVSTSATASPSASNDVTDSSIPSITSSSESSSITSISSSISVSSSSASATSSVASAELPVVTSSTSSSSSESTSVPASSSASSSVSVSSSTSSASSSQVESSTSSTSEVPSSSASATSSAVASSSAASSSSAAASTSSSAVSSSAAASSASSSASASTTSSSAPAPAPTDASLVGCYSSTTAFANANMTCDATSPRMCKIWCNAMGFTYAGLHNGDYCGCSNEVANLNQVEITQCNTPCIADGSKTCGGKSAFEVFEAAPLGKARRDLSHTARGRAKWVRKSEE